MSDVELRLVNGNHQPIMTVGTESERLGTDVPGTHPAQILKEEFAKLLLILTLVSLLAPLLIAGGIVLAAITA